MILQYGGTICELCGDELDDDMTCKNCSKMTTTPNTETKSLASDTVFNSKDLTRIISENLPNKSIADLLNTSKRFIPDHMFYTEMVDIKDVSEEKHGRYKDLYISDNDGVDKFVEMPELYGYLENLGVDIRIDTHMIPFEDLLNLTYLSFSPNFRLEPNIFPPSLVDLNLYDPKYELLPDVFPPNLVKLSLKYKKSYNLLPGVLPANLKKLDLEYDGKVHEGVLPNSLTTLTFDSMSPLPDELPPGLTYLQLGNGFQQDLSSYVLPDSISTLAFSHLFHGELPKRLPASLKYLYIPRSYRKPNKAGLSVIYV